MAGEVTSPETPREQEVPPEEDDAELEVDDLKEEESSVSKKKKKKKKKKKGCFSCSRGIQISLFHMNIIRE